MPRFFLTVWLGFGLVALLIALSVAMPAHAQAEAEVSAEPAPHVVLVLTNHATLGHTGEPTGYWLAEAAHPWKVFTDAGFRVSFASPQGGGAPVTPRSIDTDDPVNASFLAGPIRNGELDHTLRVDALDLDDIDALFFVGGYGTMWDFPSQRAIGNAIVHVDRQGGVVAAVCHGPAALVGVVRDDGRPFVEGKRLAAFTNGEESAMDRLAVVPFLLETRLGELGAEFVAADDFQENAVVDGRLVTGQNPASAEAVAHAVVKLLAKPGETTQTTP
ncbi:MAG: type 1 glutamine amidotransferase domain-containing protein [Planctomycetota bacterium]